MRINIRTVKAALVALASGVLLLTTAGCSSTAQPSAATQVRANLTPEVSYALPSAGVSTPFAYQQLLTAHYAGDSHQLLVQLQGDAKGLTLAGLTPFGLKLFTASFTAQGLEVSKLNIPGKLPEPAQVLSDIMLALYPAETMQAALPEGFVLQDKGMQRLLTAEAAEKDRGQTVYVIDYSMQQGHRLPVRIEQKIFGYVIELSYLSIQTGEATEPVREDKQL